MLILLFPDLSILDFIDFVILGDDLAFSISRFLSSIPLEHNF